MYRRLFKFAVTTISILTINLISSKISEFMIGYKSQYKPLTFTLIAMGVITLLYYPLLTRMEEWLNELSAKIVRSGSSLGGKYLGLLAMFLICLLILLYFYARMWYNIDLIRHLFAGTLRSLF